MRAHPQVLQVSFSHFVCSLEVNDNKVDSLQIRKTIFIFDVFSHEFMGRIECGFECDPCLRVALAMFRRNTEKRLFHRLVSFISFCSSLLAQLQHKFKHQSYDVRTPHAPTYLFKLLILQAQTSSLISSQQCSILHKQFLHLIVFSCLHPNVRA